MKNFIIFSLVFAMSAGSFLPVFGQSAPSGSKKDISVDNIQVDIDDLSYGQILITSITASVKNNGTDSITRGEFDYSVSIPEINYQFQLSKSSWFLGRLGRFTLGLWDQILGSVYMPAGSSKRPVVYDWKNWGLTQEVIVLERGKVYTLVFSVDPDNKVSESNENNNKLIKKISYGVGGPDIAVKQVEAAREGNNIDLAVTFANLGSVEMKDVRYSAQLYEQENNILRPTKLLSNELSNNSFDISAGGQIRDSIVFKNIKDGFYVLQVYLQEGNGKRGAAYLEKIKDLQESIQLGFTSFNGDENGKASDYYFADNNPSNNSFLRYMVVRSGEVKLIETLMFSKETQDKVASILNGSILNAKRVMIEMYRFQSGMESAANKEILEIIKMYFGNSGK
ncbi:MAG: CARDB domain-containing protein [Patescibacteria group bacterium]